jgi:hypothetical protein
MLPVSKNGLGHDSWGFCSIELPQERYCGFSICHYMGYWECAEEICSWNPIIEYKHADLYLVNISCPADATGNPAMSK